MLLAETANDLGTIAKCLLPETHETIKFDAKNECNICFNYNLKKKNINWKKKKKDLDSLISKYKGKLWKRYQVLPKLSH